MNLIKNTKKYLITNKLAKRSFLQLDKAFEDNDKKMKTLIEELDKHDK